MKPFYFLLPLVLSITASVVAQDTKSPFRKGYTRLGIQSPGNKPEPALTPEKNILKGNFGMEMGYVLEKGKIFYFISPGKAKLFNAGLDWTIFSISASPSSKSWKKYVDAASGYSPSEFKAKFAASIATKLGPVISINPVQDFVIDVRVQASLGSYILGPLYSSDDKEREFYTINLQGSATPVDLFKKVFSNTALKPNIGTTVRWRGIGLAADYSPGKINTFYSSVNGTEEKTGREKIPFNTFQLKLSFQK